MNGSSMAKHSIAKNIALLCLNFHRANKKMNSHDSAAAIPNCDATRTGLLCTVFHKELGSMSFASAEPIVFQYQPAPGIQILGRTAKSV